MNIKTEAINCLFCNTSESTPWATENGYTAVKCVNCGLVYVNPRPVQSLISDAVKTGVHSELDNGRTAVAHHVRTKANLYKSILANMFDEVWASNTPISWLDVGAGYGEVVQAVSSLAPKGSKIIGLEPMKPKVEHAKARGLTLREEYLHDVKEKFDFLSLINVYSHIPDFRLFLNDVKNVLTKNGEFFIETGNIGDLTSPQEVPAELDLPDHLVFAGEKHIVDHLQESGFSIIYIKRRRKDGLLNFAKNIIKKFIGRKVTLAIPYTSAYRTLLIRAKLI